MNARIRHRARYRAEAAQRGDARRLSMSDRALVAQQTHRRRVLERGPEKRRDHARDVLRERVGRLWRERSDGVGDARAQSRIRQVERAQQHWHELGQLGQRGLARQMRQDAGECGEEGGLRGRWDVSAE